MTGADAELVRYERGEVLARAIATLPEPYRLPLILCHFEGLSTAVIAERLGLGRAAVKSRVHRSRLLIRASLAAYVAGGGNDHAGVPESGVPDRAHRSPSAPRGRRG